MGVPLAQPLPTASELVRLCPIDGDLAKRHTPQPRDIEELRRVARHLATELNAAGDRSWANLFRQALSRSDDEFVRLMGDSLALLLRRGPLGDLDTAGYEIEQLLVDTVALWPARAAGNDH